MTRARFSPARKVAAVTLTAATAFYLGAMVHNVVPNDKVGRERWEPAPAILIRPASPTSSSTSSSSSSTTLAPGTITWTNTPDGRCHEDMACWDCATMGNRRCGPSIRRIPQVP